MKSDRIQRARRQKRGTASVEVVVMLPFFILVYAGVYYMHGHYSGRQQAMLTARTCAWSFAAAGCPKSGEEDFKRCLSPKGDGADLLELPADDSPPPTHDPDGVGSKVGHALDTIQKIPVLGDAVGWLFGRPLGASATQLVQLPRPAVSNTERIAVTGRYYTMCNSTPKSWSTLAKDIFCSVLGKGTLNC